MNDVRTAETTEASRAQQPARVAFAAFSPDSISHRQMELAKAPRDYLH